jgi:hypothetical protein
MTAARAAALGSGQQCSRQHTPGLRADKAGTMTRRRIALSVCPSNGLWKLNELKIVLS